jgi:hypothetical protein
MIITYQYVRIIRGESTQLNNIRHVPHLKVVWILGYLVPVDNEDPVAQLVEILHHGEQMHARQPITQSRQSAKLFLQSSELGLAHPTLACGRGVGGVPIPARGHTLWYSVYISTLWPIRLTEKMLLLTVYCTGSVPDPARLRP